jgi:hypothetical protein
MSLSADEMARPRAKGNRPAASEPAAPCPDPNRCEYRHRHHAGPWSCAFNHPRQGDAQRAELLGLPEGGER